MDAITYTWHLLSRKQRRYKKWWLRQLDIKRHLSEYSIRTADHLTHVGVGNGVANKAYEEEEESIKSNPVGNGVAHRAYKDEEESIRSNPSQKSSPRPDSSTSADVHNSLEDTTDTEREEILDDNMNDINKHMVT